jgi:methyl acetate hydrolase
MRAVLVVALLASISVGAQPASPTAALDAQLASRLDQHRIPGAVAIAVSRSRVLYRGAFGVADAASRTPMTPTTIFRIASMTKLVTSVAAMQLVEQGRVHLDDPVTTILAELTQPPERRAITLRHLLTHTSGLGYNFTSPVVRDFKPPAGQRVVVGPLLFEAGERWLYGTSTDWVGRLVERVSGKTLDAYFSDHILAPLGMDDTFFNVPAEKQARRAQGSGRPAA